MKKEEFSSIRRRLGKTQRELAEFLGVSIKAVHSYEQGWRKIPGHVERQLLYLLLKKETGEEEIQPCWIVKHCPPERREGCPAWEFKSGDLCWFINGTICEGFPRKNWDEKMQTCRSCKMLTTRITCGW